MFFKNRKEAGIYLAEKLLKYKGKDVVIYALPRGGVETAYAISSFLKAPLEFIITRKIGHPQNPEYAIAAISESGQLIGNPAELEEVSNVWFENEVENQKEEIKRRKDVYLGGRKTQSPKGKIAILVDDGVATGLTLRAGIAELRHLGAEKVIVAIPFAPKSSADIIKNECDELVAINIVPEGEFLGSVGAYYKNFEQVSDERVIELLR
jgi:predicted phosphoribosyltransferase